MGAMLFGFVVALAPNQFSRGRSRRAVQCLLEGAGRDIR
jgi:hypothetical protein